MQILVSKPQLERFIESQISEGRFSTPTDVVEAALVRLMEFDADAELDDETYDKVLRPTNRSIAERDAVSMMCGGIADVTRGKANPTSIHGGRMPPRYRIIFSP